MMCTSCHPQSQLTSCLVYSQAVHLPSLAQQSSAEHGSAAEQQVLGQDQYSSIPVQRDVFSEQPRHTAEAASGV